MELDLEYDPSSYQSSNEDELSSNEELSSNKESSNEDDCHLSDLDDDDEVQLNLKSDVDSSRVLRKRKRVDYNAVKVITSLPSDLTRGERIDYDEEDEDDYDFHQVQQCKEMLEACKKGHDYTQTVFYKFLKRATKSVLENVGFGGESTKNAYHIYDKCVKGSVELDIDQVEKGECFLCKCTRKVNHIVYIDGYNKGKVGAMCSDRIQSWINFEDGIRTYAKMPFDRSVYSDIMSLHEDIQNAHVTCKKKIRYYKK